jgi:hypothetical protein
VPRPRASAPGRFDDIDRHLSHRLRYSHPRREIAFDCLKIDNGADGPPKDVHAMT